ncbi:hypothetical protein ACLB9X_18025 [Streptomyces sp. 5K101]|uniref:hypothetical protein n=1 Tax=Streptomyces sp. 5K101 TaxID=3390037 RepID=UPI00397487F3
MGIFRRAIAPDGTTRSTPDEPARRLRAEITRLREEAERQRGLAHRRAEFWTKVDIGLGFPAALLAATAGATGLATANARIPAAPAALAAAGFAAARASCAATTAAEPTSAPVTRGRRRRAGPR